MTLLVVVFPQSSCSFWPFAHMSAVNSMEENGKHAQPTFNINFALSLLACSLPFSTLLILGVFSFTGFFVQPLYVLVVGLSFTAVSFIPYLVKQIQGMKEQSTRVSDFNVLPGLEDLGHKEAS